jgi:transglutaminase-like putative cysteine protease
MLRLLGIPARYLSGYVCPHDNNLRGEGATYAWVEAYIPFYGWLGLDPTNNGTTATTITASIDLYKIHQKLIKYLTILLFSFP